MTMKTAKNENTEERKAIETVYILKCMYFGRKYRITKKLMEMESSPEVIRERENNADYDEILFHHLDKCLLQCGKKNQFFILKEYMEENPENWYMPYFSKSTYERRKKSAAKEFVDYTGF